MYLRALIFALGVCTAYVKSQNVTFAIVPPSCSCPPPSVANLPGQTTPKPPKPICGSDGQQYPDECVFANAKALHPNLGSRPCTFPPNIIVCLSTGRVVNDTQANINQYLLENPTIGVRCNGGCPCPLTCPNS